MTLSRLAALQLILAGGLGSVFLLPKDISLKPAAIDPELPDYIDLWTGSDQPITQLEREVLGPDTTIKRKTYTNPQGDEVYVSIVLSGPDMNTSIHRPERCLPAQGWTIADSKPVTVPVSDGQLSATRLYSIRNMTTEHHDSITINGINYYWFVGHSDVTASHLRRTWIDIRDRVLRGENQQWAYVTIGATITKGLKVFGRDEHQTEEVIQQFIRTFAEYEKSRGATLHGS